MGLLDSTACPTIRDVRARKFERALAVVAGARVELRGMVREGEEMPSQKLFEAAPRGVEMCPRLVDPALRDQHIGKTPPDLRIAA